MNPTSTTPDDANTCSPSTSSEARRQALRQHEKTIRRYEQSSLEAGSALTAIRDGVLFEVDGYDDLRAYVESTCAFDFPRARQLIRGAESLIILRAAGVEPLPTTEAQVRPLVPLAADDQARAWRAAVDATGGQQAPSKSAVRDVVDVMTGKAARRAAENTRDWPRDAVRHAARLDERNRSAIVGRTNDLVTAARAMLEGNRDAVERDAATGVTLHLVEMVAEAHLAEVAESGLDTGPSLAGTAAEATEADPDFATPVEGVPEAASQIVSKGYRTLIIPGVQNPLLVEVPRKVIPTSFLRGVPDEAKTVLVEIGELERRGGPVDNGVLRHREIQEAAQELSIVATMNATNESVDWARFTSNMLTGCLHACAGVFCYAAAIANYLFAQRFTPTLYPVRLGHFESTKLPVVTGMSRDDACRARSVFSTSMGDLFGAWVPSWYIELVLDEVRQHSGWFVFFLTKNARRLKDFDFPLNCAVGATITGEDRYLIGCDGGYLRHSPTPTEQIAYYEGLAADLAAVRGAAFTWLSLEPFRAEVYTLQPFFEAGVAMIAVGGQSRTSVCPAEQPDYRWVERVRTEVRAAGVRLFEKDNLRAQPKEIPFPDDWLRDAL